MIKSLNTSDADYQQVLSLRNEVLRKPLGLDIYNDDLRGEDACTHFAYFRDDDCIIGCLQVKHLATDLFQIRQMAVLHEYQRQGIGTRLMDFAEEHIQRIGGQTVLIEARDYACGFYTKLGYHIEGAEFEKIGLPHHTMKKRLVSNSDLEADC